MNIVEKVFAKYRKKTTERKKHLTNLQEQNEQLKKEITLRGKEIRHLRMILKKYNIPFKTEREMQQLKRSKDGN